MESTTISILGCGWTGYALAKTLVKNGYSVKGSTTSHDKLSLMKTDGIDPFLVQLSPEVISDREGFFDSSLLIITIPPKKDHDLYVSQIHTIIRKVQKHHIKNIIFFSSTSVYGNPGKDVDETSPLIPSGSGNVIASVETLLFNNVSCRTTIIRLGGLVGPGRHPGRFLAGKTNIPNGLAPVNLIHLDDCIGIVCSIVENNVSGKIINACSPDHPTRENYYTLAARTAGLEEPRFINELKEWKIVNSNYIPEVLNYDFRIKDWLAWLRSAEAKQL